MSLVLAISWLMQDQPGLKPDCLEELRLFRKCLSWSVVYYAVMTPFLMHWHYISFFYSAGKTSWFKQDLKIIYNGS